MDPQTCLLLLYQMTKAKNWSEAVQALSNYYQWRLKKGFEPPHVEIDEVIRRGDETAELLAARLADALEPHEQLVEALRGIEALTRYATGTTPDQKRLAKVCMIARGVHKAPGEPQIET